MSSHAPSERARRALERMEAAQARSRARFLESGPERDLLLELLEASCLLELAKIEPSSLDPASYAQLAVDVLVQLYPISGCALSFVGATGRTAEVFAGSVAVVDWSEPLVFADDVIGEMRTGRIVGELLDADGFLRRSAALVAQGLATALRTEALRRQAATATAARIASDLHRDAVEQLDELVQALATFPGVIAADLVVDHAAIGPPIDLRSGYWDDDGRVHAVQTVSIDVGAAGRIAGRLRSVDDGDVDAGALREVLETLGASLERLADTHRLREEAETEPLTGMGNRRRLERVLVESIARARRVGDQVAVLVVDVDRLKSVNDVFGRDAGDDIIFGCVAALRESVGPYDELVRLDGDEFVVVAPVRDVLDALRLADAVRVGISTRCREMLPPGNDVSANIGVALYPDSGREAETLLRAADAAVHRAKSEGCDGVAVAAASTEVLGSSQRRRFFRRAGS